jgi:hypothetical protein
MNEQSILKDFSDHGYLDGRNKRDNDWISIEPLLTEAPPSIRAACEGGAAVYISRRPRPTQDGATLIAGVIHLSGDVQLPFIVRQMEFFNSFHLQDSTGWGAALAEWEAAAPQESAEVHVGWGGRRPGAGRPTLGDAPMREAKVHLLPRQIEWATAHGGGNLSAGVRKALDTVALSEGAAEQSTEDRNA